MPGTDEEHVPRFDPHPFRALGRLEVARSEHLPRAQALLARAIAPRNEAVVALAEGVSTGSDPDPDEVRKALLASVGGGSTWTPSPPPR